MGTSSSKTRAGERIVFPANTDAQFIRLMNSSPKKVKFVRTIKDWRKFVRNSNKRGHPLQRLTEEEVESFSKSLYFGKAGGLASAKISEISAKLTVDEFGKLFESFGLSMRFMYGASEDHKGYQCVGPGNCKESEQYLCNPSACGAQPKGGLWL